MEAMVLALVLAGAIVAILPMPARRPGLRPQVAVARVPRSAVRELKNDGEVDDTLRRAARLERDEAETRRRRADRYEDLIRPAHCSPVPGPPAGSHGVGAREVRLK